MNNSTILDNTPLYWPLIKSVPARGRYETTMEAATRLLMWEHKEHTIIFDLSGAGDLRKQSRQLLRRTLDQFREKNPTINIALQVNSFDSNEYRQDIKLITDTQQYDAVILPLQKESDVETKIKTLSDIFDQLKSDRQIIIVPIIAGSQSLIIARRLLNYPRVPDVIFDERDFALSMGLPSSRDWPPGAYMQLSRKHCEYEGLATQLVK